MSETKHTPGPWRYQPHSVDSNYMLIFCGNDPSEGDNLRGYCGEANARLIAAAPELLGALEKVAELFDNDMVERLFFINKAKAYHLAMTVDQARAAIAKAKGEAL